jgi:hypothetical protein
VEGFTNNKFYSLQHCNGLALGVTITIEHRADNSGLPGKEKECSIFETLTALLNFWLGHALTRLASFIEDMSV